MTGTIVDESFDRQTLKAEVTAMLSRHGRVPEEMQDSLLEHGRVPMIKVIELQAANGSSDRSSGLRHISSKVKLHARGLPFSMLIGEYGLFPINVTSRLKGLILLNLVMLAMASTFVVLKEGQVDFDPYIFSLIRFIIAAAIFSPFWRRAFKDEKLVKAGLEIGVWAAGGYLTQSIAMVTGDASRGAFLSGFTVVVVPLLAGTFGKARLKKTTWISVMAALIGMSLLEESGAPASWGDFWSFASAVLFALQIFRTEYWSKVFGAKAALPLMSVALISITGITALCTFLVYPQRTLIVLQHPHLIKKLLSKAELPWGAILYMAVGVTNIGLWWEVIALQEVSSTEAAIIYTLEPLCGAVFAYIELGERWGFTGWIGAVLILGSCLITQLYGAEKEGH